MRAGGQAVYDATAIDYGRDPVALKTISERTGIRIIATAGFNKAVMWPGQMQGPEHDLPGLDRRPTAGPRSATISPAKSPPGSTEQNCAGGVVKFGTGYNTISASEDKVLRATLDAHKETNAPIHSHTELGTLILEQLAIVKPEGVDPSRLTIAHVDRNPDPWVHAKAAETGVYLCFDGIAASSTTPRAC